MQTIESTESINSNIVLSKSNLRQKFEKQLTTPKSIAREPINSSTYFNGDDIKDNDKLLFALLTEVNVKDAPNYKSKFGKFGEKNETNIGAISYDMIFISLNEKHLDMFELNTMSAGTDNLPMIKFKSDTDRLNFLKSNKYNIK